MSPILVRPVREQLEHDRVIRLLQVKLKRKHEVIANIGEDQSTSIKIGPAADLSRPRPDDRRSGPETDGNGRSGDLGIGQPPRGAVAVGPSRPRARAVSSLRSAGSVDIARRLAAENHVNVTEIWSFHTIGDQTHFRLVQRTPEDTPAIERTARHRHVQPPRAAEAGCASAAAAAGEGRRAAAVPPPRQEAPQPPRTSAVAPSRKEARRRRTAGQEARWRRPRAKLRCPRAARRRPASPLRHAPRKGSRPCRICGSIATSKATRTPSSSKAIAGAGGRGRACSIGFARRPA